MSPQARLIVAILLIMTVFAIGTVGYMVIERDSGITFFDAAYMTVITVSTVGFTEVWHLSPLGRLWTVGTIVFGIATVSYAFTSLIALIVGGELRELRESRKMEKTIGHLDRHVIICGFGRIGTLVADELKRRSTPFIVIEQQRSLEFDLREASAPYILGDATDENVLTHAGLMRARALVIALPSDADAVYVTLTARTLNPDIMIVSRAEQPATESKLMRAGANRVVSPHVIGATRFANILTRPNVVDFVDVAAKGVDLEIDEYLVAQKSNLVGQTLANAHVRRKSGAMVVAIKRADGDTLTSPEPTTIIQARDMLILVGPVGVSSRLDRIDAPG